MIDAYRYRQQGTLGEAWHQSTCRPAWCRRKPTCVASRAVVLTRLAHCLPEASMTGKACTISCSLSYRNTSTCRPLSSSRRGSSHGTSCRTRNALRRKSRSSTCSFCIFFITSSDVWSIQLFREEGHADHAAVLVRVYTLASCHA